MSESHDHVKMVRMKAEIHGADEALSQSQIFQVDQMAGTTTANGGKRWNILSGVLPTGEPIEVHESQQPAGAKPNPAHTIQHSELILVLEGTLLFEYDGKSEKVGAGGIIFVAYGTMHAARNVGDGPARYVVVAIGGDAK
jgi:mannose-6-phosphate isomerase-like protein (cupin superfamily)